MSISWERFFAALERLAVPIPTFDPGEVIDIDLVGRLMLKAQKNRQLLDRFSNKLAMKLAEAKRALQIQTQQLRLERAMAVDEPGVRSCRGKAEKAAQVEFLTSHTGGVVAMLRGRVQEYEVAMKQVEAALRSMQYAKESLNSVRRMAQGEYEDARFQS